MKPDFRKYFALLMLLFAMACQHKPELAKVSFNGEAQGTYYAITYYDANNRNLQPEIDSILLAFDQSVSLWVENSIISRINKDDSTALPDEIFKYNFLLSKEIAAATGGAFDFTISPLVTAWGFGLREREKITPQLIDSLKQLVDYRKVRLENGKIVRDDPRIKFDFNAIAQGHSVDLICRFLDTNGIKSYVVDVGGEVYASNVKPDGGDWRVGVEKPAAEKMDEREVQLVIALKNKGLATSGSYRKYYVTDGKRYSHAIDPKTGYPVSHNLLSVTVLADNAAIADGYSTAFMVLGVEQSLELINTLPDIEALFITAKDDGGFDLHMTPGFEDLLRD